MSVKISAQEVAKLRKMTGSGMMDCKKALVEAEGDYDKAVEILRKKGQKLSAKRADRETNEGAAIALVNADQTKGIVLNLSCETDFVAMTDSFVAMAKEFAQMALEHFPANKEELLALKMDGGLTIGEKITEQVGVIGEKLDIPNYARLEAPMVVSYIHAGNKIGVLLGLTKNDASFNDAGRSVAMQVAAMNPLAVNKDAVDASVVAKEIEIGKDIARNEGKAEDLIERIAMGKLNKFFAENTLLGQKFVKNPKETVQGYLNSVEKGLTATDFKRVAVGG